MTYRHIFKLLLIVALLWLLAACTSNGIFHTVKPGQTLYRIAKTYEVDEAKLARVNDINDPKQLKAGQRLYIPGRTRQLSVPATATTSVAKKSVSSRPAVTTPSKKSTKKTTSVKKSSSVKKTTKPTSTKKRVSSSSRPKKGLFIWPVKGKVVNKFGANSKSTYKGIEIAVPSGSKVAAAASGKVIYSGDAIRGYGNLVILEHSDGYFTVYGYNQRNLVTRDDFVGQGDKIALSGSPGKGQSARLHFEIRQGKSAVNPIFYLP